MKTLHRVASLAGFAGALAVSPALSDSYKKPDLRVMPADSVINVPSHQQSYKLGDALFLNRQNRFPAAADKDLVQTGFELRIFRINDAQADPTPWFPNQDSCDIFMTLVFKHLKFRGDRVDLGPLEDNHWLTLTSGGYFLPGHFLLVIEQDSAADAPSERNRWEVFRLASALRDDYFKQGVRIEIDPTPGLGPPVKPPDEETRMKQALEVVARSISSKSNCYQTKPISTACGRGGGDDISVLHPKPRVARRSVSTTLRHPAFEIKLLFVP